MKLHGEKKNSSILIELRLIESHALSAPPCILRNTIELWPVGMQMGEVMQLVSGYSFTMNWLRRQTKVLIVNEAGCDLRQKR